MARVMQEISSVIEQIATMAGFRGAVVLVLHFDNEAGSVKLHTRVFPFLEL